ncbi:MAG: Fe-S protein, partial [Limnohabitans sp.]|nr:Fe-S protein [Limnohabitans sp.]
WIEMSPGEKRSIWHRITMEGNSWRFNRYAERAAEDRHWAKAAAEAQVPLDLKP